MASSKTKQEKRDIKAAKARAGAKPKVASTLISTLFNPSTFAPPKKLEEIAFETLKCLNNLIHGRGAHADWAAVLERVTVGSYSYDTYFVGDRHGQVAFNQAWLALTAIAVRADLYGEWGVLVRELDSITRALAATDEMCRVMTQAQNAQIFNHVTSYYKQLEKDNQKLYPKNWREVEAMNQQLAREFEEVKNQPDPLKEAA